MSRRRGEFEHRTSIFEGAFRAWSHLGGLTPDDVENKPASDLDPLTNPLESDPRVGKSEVAKNPDGTPRREYPYEPLPRSGLAHPYVQAILSPWLGPDADNEAIQLGLTTLRTWWQHRRKGESGSAIAALGTEKMKGVVEGYTRHFFTLAHCIVVNEKVQPPRSLHTKMKEVEKIRTKSKRKKKAITDGDLNAIQTSLMDPNLTPLEKLHIAQRRQQESTGATMGAAPVINLKGKCVPGKIDLPGVVDSVNRHTQFVHRGGGDGTNGAFQSKEDNYGDPNTTPVVFVSSNGAIQIALKVDGITCAHCVKIVETVLRGCNGNKSPIRGLLDAAADRDLCSVLIRIDKAGNAKRIAFEAARNLSMVGYTAKAMDMSIVGEGTKGMADLNALATAFEVVASTKPQEVFDWTIVCTCPDNGILRGDCARHSQMNTRIFDAFNQRQQEVTQYMAGCGMKYGMECSCGPSCSCEDCPVHSGTKNKAAEFSQQGELPSMQLDTVTDFDEGTLQIDQPMQLNNFGVALPSATVAEPNLQPLPFNASAPAPTGPYAAQQNAPQQSSQPTHHQATRNPSILSYRGSIRHHNMSITSETFGRAMSGLSALSIDWENLEDFDLDVDHSANIQQHRASIRRSIAAPPSDAANSSQQNNNSYNV